MYVLHGRQHEIGLGSARRVSLGEAREKAVEYHSLLSRGIDPLSEKVAAEEAMGRRRLTMGDGIFAYRFKNLTQDITTDCGGRSELSAIEMQLIRRVGALSVECERLEVKAAGNSGFTRDDLADYIGAANTLKRLGDAIGVKRRSRDVSPKLSDYLEAKAEPPVEAVEEV